MCSTAFRILLLVSLLTVCAAVPQRFAYAASPFTITSSADAVDADLNDGICAAANGECTLRAAVQQANVLSADTTIIVPTGAYTLTLSPVGGEDEDPEHGDLDITHSLTLIGAGTGATVIDGAQIDRVFTIWQDSTVQMSGVTIQHGRALAAAGGGISNYGDLFLSDSIIRNNTTIGFGAGIANYGILTATQTLITENVAPFTGGGGIYNMSGQLTLTKSTISNNQGGGLRNETGFRSTVTDSTFHGNTSFQGGGILNGAPANLIVTNTTISDNTATNDYGGGIAHLGTGNLTLINSTITANSAIDEGGGIYKGDTGQVRVLNTIVANNPQGGNCAGTITSNGFNLDSGTTCGFAATGDLSDTDPQLGPLINNGGVTATHALAKTSPAIDAGTNTGCPAYDQRGIARPQGQLCDIGAYEVTRVSYLLPLILHSSMP